MPFKKNLFFSNSREVKKAQKALEESNAFSRGVLASLSSCVAVIDESGTIIAVNKAWEDFAKENGVTTLERVASGANYFTVCNKAAAAGDDIAAQAVKGIQSVLKKEIKVFELQYPCHAPDKQRWFLLRVMLFENGKPMAVVAHNNITEIVLSKQKLEESENRLRTIYNTEPECIKLLGPKGELLDMNPAGLAMIEAANLEMVKGQSVLGIITPQHRDAFTKLTQSVFKGNSGVLEFEITGLKGTHRWLETHAVPLKDDGGEIISLLGVTRDITEQKKAKDDLRQSEATQRLIMHSALDAIICMNTNGIITIWTPQAEKIFGWKEEEVLGKTVAETIIPASYREQHKKGVENYLKTGEEKVLGKLTEITAINREGKEFPVELTIVSIKQGTVEFFCAYIRDITQRKKIEEKHAILALRNEALVQAFAEIVYEWNPLEDTVIWGGDFTKILGYTSDEIGSDAESWSSRVHPDDYKKVFKEVEMATQQRRLYNLEYRFLKKDGTYCWMHDSGVTYVDEKGTLTRMIGVFRDVTERKEAEAVEGRLLNVLQKSLNEIYIFNVDTLQFEYVNNGALRNLGYSMEEMSGMTPLDIKPEFTMTQFRELIKPLVNHEKEKIAFETVHKRADRSLYPVEIHLQLITHEEQSVFLAVILDITVRKKAQLELRKSETKLREITASLPGVVYQTVINTDGKMAFNFLSDGIKKYGDEKIEDIYKDSNILFSKVHPGDVDRLRSAIALSSKNLTPLTISYRIFTKGGKYIWVRSDSIPVLQEDGTVLRNGALIDVTETKEAEEALQKSEADLKQAQRIAHIGSWDLNLTDNVLNWSDEIYRIFEIDPKKFGASYKAFVEAIHPEDRDMVNAAYTQSVKNRTAYSIEHRLLFPDGRIKFVHEQCKTFYDEKGIPLRSLGTVQDITERKVAAEELNTAHKQLLFHVENAPLGYVEWDNQLFVKSWSKKAEKIFGWTEKELEGKQKNGFSMVYEDDVPRLNIIAQQLMEGSVGRNHIIHRNYTKDGRVIWCEWFNSVLKDEEGKVITIMSLVQDITERKLAEEKIKASETKYRSVMQQAGDSIVLFDGTGQLLDVNESALQLLGYSGKEYKKMSLKDFVFEDDLKKNPFRFDLLNKGEPTITRRKLKRKDGLEVEAELHVKKLSDGRYLGVARDLTERMEAEKQLSESEHKYRAIVEKNLAGIYQTTPKGKILTCNAAFARMLGYTAEFLQQQNAGILYFFNTDRKEFINLLQKKGEIINQETVLKHKDGSPVYIVESCSLIKNPVSGEEIIEGVLIDITKRKKAEQALTESEQRYRSLVEQASDGIVVVDLQGNIIEANSALCSMFGYTREEVLEENVFSFLEPNDLKLKPMRFDLLGKGHSLLVERRAVHKNGNLFDIELSSKLIGDGKVLSIIRNVSERKKAEEQLKISEEKYRSFFSQSADAIFVFDESGHFLDVNNVSAKLVGYTKKELRTMSLNDIIFKKDLATNPIRLDILATGEAVIRQRTLKKKNGAAVEVEIHSKKLPDGKYLGIVRDITERQKAEERIREQEKRFRSLVDTAPDATIIADEKGIIRIANRQAMKLFGYANAELTGKPVEMLIPQSLHHKHKKHREKYSKEPGTRAMGIGRDLIAVRKDGSIIPVEISLAAFQSAEGTLVTASIRDITQRKKAEKELEESFRSVRQLTEHLQNIREEERTHIAREIHDELGQQLTVMMMDVSWLDKKIDNENSKAKEKTKELLAMLNNTVKTIRRISTELRPSVLDDLGLAAAMELHLKEFEKRSAIHTRLTTPKKEIQLTDPVKNALFRIFQESLTNVARHSGAKTVTVKLEKKINKIILMIADNGVGFDEKKASAKRTLGVLGMKERAAGAGGEYHISGKPGKGTTILVSIPLQKAQVEKK